VLLKQPGVPGFACAWWHCAQTGAFDGSVVVCVFEVEESQGLRGCGEKTPTPWQAGLLRHVTFAPPPVKSAAWQIWQEANPELPGAFFAEAPCFAGVAQFATGSWWQPAGFPKQETREMPPVRSDPWHSVQPLLPPLAM
jgi:hypothetical protein